MAVDLSAPAQHVLLSGTSAAILTLGQRVDPGVGPPRTASTLPASPARRKRTHSRCMCCAHPGSPPPPPPRPPLAHPTCARRPARSLTTPLAAPDLKGEAALARRFGKVGIKMGPPLANERIAAIKHRASRIKRACPCPAFLLRTPHRPPPPLPPPRRGARVALA